MMTTDIQNRIIYITRPIIPIGKVKIRGAEPVDPRSGMVRLKSGRKLWGTSYNQMLIDNYGERKQFVSGGKVWKIVIREPGQGCFKEKCIGKDGKPIRVGKDYYKTIAKRRVAVGGIHRIMRVRKSSGLAQSSLHQQAKRFTNKERVAHYLFK